MSHSTEWTLEEIRTLIAGAVNAVSGVVNVAIGNGADVAEGTTTDAPASATAYETAAAATTISLLKRIKNFILNIDAVLGAPTGVAVITDAVGTIQQYLRGLVALWLGGLKAGAEHIGQVGGHVFKSTGALTRTADTNAYAALDAITTATSSAATVSFLLVPRVSGGGVTITSATLIKSTTTVTNANFRLWLFNAAPAAIPNDNAAYALPIADQAKFIGYVDFTNPILGADNVMYSGTLVPGVMTCLPAATTVVGIWQALAAYAPGSSEVFSCSLRGFQE